MQSTSLVRNRRGLSSVSGQAFDSYVLGPFVGVPGQALTFDFGSGSYDSDLVTLTRASSATYIDASGVLQTVTSDTIRDAAHTHDLTDTLTGPFLLIEGAATNHVTEPRDLTDAAWTKSASMGAALNATGIDGTPTSATTLTASADNQTVTEALTLAADEYTFSARVKRVTGAGRIDITLDGGTTWHERTPFLLDGEWMRIEATQTLANPEVGFRIVNSGDAISVDACQLEAGEYATSDILTGGGTRAADVLSIDLADGLTWDFSWSNYAQISDAALIDSMTFSGINKSAKTCNVAVTWFDPATGGLTTDYRASEAISYPDIVGPSTWSLPLGASKSGNEFTFTSVAQNAICSDFDLFEIETEYEYILDITSISSGAVRFGYDAATVEEVDAVGTYTGTFTSTKSQARLTARTETTTATFTLTIRRA